MGAIRKKGLAVCMMVLLALLGTRVSAERQQETSSGGDAAGEQVMPYAAGDIASGTDGNITWVIDASGKLTVNGTGDLSGNHADGNFAWKPYCEQITSAEINVTGMTDASFLFYGCENMTSVNMGGFSTSNVTDMSSMFYGCTGLQNIDVSSFSTGNVTNMGGMFLGCTSLTRIDVSSFDTSSVTNMASMFAACNGLTDLDMSGLILDNVMSIGGMLSGCLNLETLKTPQSMGAVTVDLPETFVNVSGTEMQQLSQESCNTTLTKKGLGDSGDIASGTDGALNWVIDAAGKLTVTGTGDRTGSGFAWGAYSSQVTSAEINVTGMTNASYFFSGCENMTSVDMSGFATDNLADTHGMFQHCSSLTDLDVSHFNTSNVTDMSYMFSGCSSLTGLDVSGFVTANVTDMSAMFQDCSSLSGLDVSSFDTGNVSSMYNMFYGCSALTSLDVSGFNTSGVINMWQMFCGCSSLTTLDLSSFATHNVTDMKNMFSGCSGLQSLDVGSFDTSNVNNMESMFSGCSSLTSLDISSFDATQAVYIADLISSCDRLTTIQCPPNLNKVVYLPNVSGTVWQNLPDETELTEMPQGLGYSVTLTRRNTTDIPEIITTTPDLNMEDVVRVKYVPYSYTVETNNTDPDNTVTFSVVEGRLADGLQMYPATGEIYGVPIETGEFRITVKATYSNPAYLPSYAELILTVLDNTDSNVNVSTDTGYDITQPVTGFNVENVGENGTQTLISQGEYSQFRDVYIDGRKLTAGQEYTSEAGSTRITIMNQTLAEGGTGTHTLGIEFRTEDGVLKRAAQNYVIGSNIGGNAGDQTDSNDNVNSGTGNNNNNSNGNNNSNNSSNNNNSDSNNTGSIDNNSKNSADPVSFIPTETLQQEFVIYVVERNDSLWKIAVKFYGQGDRWRTIYNDNKAVIKNPGRLYAGQQLLIRLPSATTAVQETAATSAAQAATTENTYIVQKGDMLWSIADRVYGDGKLWTVIYAANKDSIKNPERIRAGQVLDIPRTGDNR